VATRRNIIGEIKSYLNGYYVTNADRQSASIDLIMWNNHLERIKSGEYVPHQFPVAYLELLPTTWNMLGMGYMATDQTFRIHFIHQQLDSPQGNWDENTDVYILRDTFLQYLMNYSFEGTNMFAPTFSEQIDTDHGNLYHYIFDFTVHVIEDVISAVNLSSGNFIIKEPPTDLELTVTKE